MKTQKPLITLFLTILFTQASFSQEIIIPNNVKLESEKDYKEYETEVVNCINWLENTPMNQNINKRQMANAFLTQWASGTPTVTLEIQPFQLNLAKKNTELIMIFVGGFIKYSIENPNKKYDLKALNIAGINSIIKVYSANKDNGIKKDKRIEKLIVMSESELQNWVGEKL